MLQHQGRLLHVRDVKRTVDDVVLVFPDRIGRVLQINRLLLDVVAVRIHWTEPILVEGRGNSNVDGAWHLAWTEERHDFSEEADSGVERSKLICRGVRQKLGQIGDHREGRPEGGTHRNDRAKLGRSLERRRCRVGRHSAPS